MMKLKKWFRKLINNIVMQGGNDDKTAETLNFEDFREIFDTDVLPMSAIESLFNVETKQIVSEPNRVIYDSWSKEELSQINRAIYDAWSEETGYTFEELYPPPNPLRSNPEYLECRDCNARGATGWGNQRVECTICDGAGYLPRATKTQKYNEIY